MRVCLFIYPEIIFVRPCRQPCALSVCVCVCVTCYRTHLPWSDIHLSRKFVPWPGGPSIQNDLEVHLAKPRDLKWTLRWRWYHHVSHLTGSKHLCGSIPELPEQDKTEGTWLGLEYMVLALRLMASCSGFSLMKRVQGRVLRESWFLHKYLA